MKERAMTGFPALLQFSKLKYKKAKTGLTGLLQYSKLSFIWFDRLILNKFIVTFIDAMHL